MNYLTSFLNWSDEPTQNATNQPPNNEPNNEPNSEPQQQYMSPLSSLTRIDPIEDSQSPKSSIISALWGSSSSPLLHQKQPPYKQNNVNAKTFTNISNTYNNNIYFQPQQNQNYNLPSITSQQQMNNIMPPSYPSAISVTASPPPILNNNYYPNTNSNKKQVKFTPKYKKKLKPNRINITNTKNINSNHKSTLLDVAFDSVELEEQGMDSPVRAPPIKPYEFKPTISNESDEFANDIVKPHPGYNNEQHVNQSTTDYVNFEKEKADDNSRNNVMMDVLGDNTYDIPTQTVLKNTHVDNNHLIANNLPMLMDNNEENDDDGELEENNEVNLQLYGIGLFDDTKDGNENDNVDDTASVVSDFEAAGMLMNSKSYENKRSSNRIRVTCNNCYLWRHYTNKLDIEMNNLKVRKNELEQNINLAENKEQSVIRNYDELKEENERLKLKNNELKLDMTKQKDELTNKLIEYRKKKENEINILNKQYQSLMKEKNKLELSYNEQVNIVNVKQAEIEKYINKYNRLDNDMIKERNKIINMNLKEKSMQATINKLQTEQKQIQSDILNKNEIERNEFEINKINEINKQNENEIMELKLKINNLSDELSDCKDENLRINKLKNKCHEQLNEIEQQLKRTNSENDKLMDENYKLMAKISRKKEEMDEYKNNMYSINNQSKEYIDEIKILTSKLESATNERDKQLKKTVRLNNRVKALQNENNSLQDSITHLESIIEDTYGLADMKNKKLNKLKRENNESQIIVDRLKNRMKKHERQKTSYRNMELEWGKKSHRKLDKKLDMVRQSNVQLQNENDELNQTNKQLNINVSDLQSQLKEKKMKFKSVVNKYESDLSQLKAENHKIYSDKINSEADLDIIKEENNKLQEMIGQLHDKLSKKRIICSCEICQRHPLKALIDLNIKTDEKYQFINRVRNIFINTNKLTPKLIMQLIESYAQSIVIFHEIKAKFDYFINKFGEHLTGFYNLQQLILDKYTSTGILISSIKYNKTKTNSPTSLDASYSSLSSLLGDNEKRRSKSNLKKFKNKNNISKIRKPIQNKKPPFHNTYNQIYKLMKEDITNALHNIEYISDMYQKPLDYKCYESIEFDDNNENKSNEIDLNDDSNNVIDYNSLLIDPSTERYQLQEMIKNNEKFENVIKNFNSYAKEMRTFTAKTTVELDVAWHSYYLNESIELDDKKIDLNENEKDNNSIVKDEYYMDFDMHSDMEMDSKYFDLMKKVNKSGPEKQKRFSIT